MGRYLLRWRENGYLEPEMGGGWKDKIIMIKKKQNIKQNKINKINIPSSLPYMFPRNKTPPPLPSNLNPIPPPYLHIPVILLVHQVPLNPALQVFPGEVRAGGGGGGVLAEAG